MSLSDVAVVWLTQLNLRQTQERVAMAQLLLDRPGLSPAEVVRELDRRAAGVDRRTVQRFLRIWASPAGAWARRSIVGVRWVCWGCGRCIADAPELASSEASSHCGAIPLDLGGYCQSCCEQLAEAGGDSRRARGRPPAPGRQTPLVPLGALYGNPSLMAELVGSTRRTTGRDYAIAVLAENPHVGPAAARQILDRELVSPPSERSLKRYTAALRAPKARVLFGSLGALGWSCVACDRWGKITDVPFVRESSPTGFALTDVRALCHDCYDSTVAIWRQSANSGSVM